MAAWHDRHLCLASAAATRLTRWHRPLSRAGTFQLSITEAGSGGAQDTGDPCSGGATLRGVQGAPGVAVSLQPDGGTTDESQCSWVVSCASAAPVLIFTALDVEEDYDFVHLYDGASSSSAQLAELTGARACAAVPDHVLVASRSTIRAMRESRSHLASA